MTKVICRTNLDLWHEQWPTELPGEPQVGDLIESATKHGVFVLRLRVVRRTWQYNDKPGNWSLSVELDDFMGRSVSDFYKWYAPLVGQSVSAFI